MSTLINKTSVALTLILLVALYVRLYKINNPIADWHSWRQADTAAVARNFYQEGFNPLIPKYDDMSGVAEKSAPNPQRYRFVEFPIYNSLVYFAYLLNNGVDEKLARLVSIIFSLGSTILIFLITKRLFNTLNGLLSSLVFALLPFNVYFSRVILPEPALVFFSLGMFYFVDLWISQNSRKLYLISLFFIVSASLIKPQAAFYLLPLVYTYYKKEGRLWPVPARYYKLFIPGVLPFISWRLWISQHPEGIPASNWLFNGDGIRLKPVFWRWILGDRLGREILAVPGTILFFTGVLKKWTNKESPMLHLLVFASLLFIIVFATGNVRHDYYQVFIVPALSIFLARGFLLLVKGIPGFMPRLVTAPIAVLLLFLTFYMSWEEVKGLYQINNPVIVEAGKYADSVLPKKAVVVAPYSGDTAFLYQINRPGWAVVAFPVQELIEKYGVTHYVSVSLDNKTNWVMKRYSTLYQSPKFVIVDLTKEKPGFDITLDPEPS